MRIILVVALYATVVELLNFHRFSKEITKNTLLASYDAVFVGLNGPLLDLLTNGIKIPKIICNISCAASRSEHVLLFSESLSENPTVFVKSHILPIILYQNSSDAMKFVQQSSLLLRKLRIAKAIYVIYDEPNMNLTLIPYGFLRSASTNLHGYDCKVQYTKIYPFIYHKKFKDKPDKIAGLDQELIETIASYQNATITFQFDPQSFIRCSQLDPSADFSIRRMSCLVISADRLYLPQWDAVCVLVPKRHEHLILLQFTKPFQHGLWIFVCIFLVVRFFVRFNRWRLLLLTVVLIEFVLTACYEVKVIQYMATLRYAPNPRTIADLINRGELFVVGQSEVEMMNTYGAGANIHVVGTGKESYIGKITLLGYCGSAEAFYNSEMNYNLRTNDRLAIVLPERISPYATSFGFAKGHALRERFECMLRWVFEAGIWRKIYDQHVRKEQQFQPLVTPGEYLIEFGDFKSLWMIGTVGWGLALGIFGVEMVWGKIQNSKRVEVKYLMKPRPDS